MNIVKIGLLISFVSFSLNASNIQEIQHLSQRINKYHNLSKLYFERAQLFLNNADVHSSILDTQAALRINPKYEEAQLFLAKLLIKKEPENALKLVNEVLKVAKNTEVLVHAYTLSGDILMNQKEFYKAQVSYSNVLKQDYAFKSAHYVNLAEACYQEGAYKKSIKVLKDAFHKNVDKLVLQEKIVELSIEEGNFSLALNLIDKMMHTEVNKAKLYEYRALIMKEQGRV